MIIQTSFQQSGLNRWIDADYIRRTKGVDYFKWMNQEGFHEWVNTLEHAAIRSDLEVLYQYLKGDRQLDDIDEYFAKVSDIENGEIIQTAFQDTYLKSLSFWKNEWSTHQGKNRRVYQPDPEIPWEKLAIWDAIGAVKGAIEFGKMGAMLGGFWGGLVIGATGAIFEGATASAAAYLEDQLEKLILR